MTRVLLTIAGTDPSGAAGIQADLQVFRDFGFHGASVVTAVLWQNTVGVRGMHALEPTQLAAQLDAVLQDIPIEAIKVGLVPTAAHWDAIRVARPAGVPLVCDPVLASGDGRTELVAPDVLAAVLDALSTIDVLTPNVPEASALIGARVTTLEEAQTAAALLVERGAKAVLLKVGHLSPSSGSLRDVWADADGARLMDPLPAIEVDVRGTGCQLSSALTAGLADGLDAYEAAQRAREYLSGLLLTRRRGIGRGRDVVVRTGSLED